MKNTERVFWAERCLRFGEVLDIGDLERGNVQGWETRGLWRYRGRERGTGKQRLYTPADLLAFRIVADVVSAGVEPKIIWAALNEIIGGVPAIERIAAGELNFYRITGHGYRGFTALNPAVADLNEVVVFVPVGVIRDRLIAQLDKYFAEIEAGTDDQILAHVSRTTEQDE